MKCEARIAASKHSGAMRRDLSRGEYQVRVTVSIPTKPLKLLVLEADLLKALSSSKASNLALLAAQ